MTLAMNRTLPTFQPIHPVEFCLKWIPRLIKHPKLIAQFGLRLDRQNPETSHQALSLKLLVALFPHTSYNAVYKWFRWENRCPRSVQIVLGAYDLTWTQIFSQQTTVATRWGRAS